MPTDEDITQTKRRRLLSYVIGAIIAVLIVAVGIPLVGYFLSPAWKKSTPTLTPVASTTDIPVGVPTFVTYEERVRDGWYVSTLSEGTWVVNKDNQEIIAFDPHCTHLRCPYYWDDGCNCFHCPCHEGLFDISGRVIGGPPPRPLDRLEVSIEDGTILVGAVIPSRK